MKKRVTFECMVDLDGDEPIFGIELKVCRKYDTEGSRWEQGLLFMFGGGQRVRNGKHLRLEQSHGEVVKVGEDLHP